MLVDEGLDTGPILLTRTTAIEAHETGADLEARLARIGAEVLLETLDAVASGGLAPQPQDHSQATLAPRLRKGDGQLDWSRPAELLERRIRAFQPWPGAATELEGRRVQVRLARLARPGADALPGSIVTVDKDGILVACGSGTRLRLVQVQPESRRVMSASAFAAGARLAPGARLG